MCLFVFGKLFCVLFFVCLCSKARENGVSVEMTEEELVAGILFGHPKEGIQVYFTILHV